MGEPFTYLAAAVLFYFLAVIVKPSPYRRLFMVPITLALVSFFQSDLRYRHFFQHALVCVVVMQFFCASDYILLTDVQRELFKQGQKEPIERRPVSERIPWALDLMFSHPCIGWSHEPTHALQPHFSPTLPRSTFLTQQTLYIAEDICIFELARTFLMKDNPCFAKQGYSMKNNGIFWLCLNLITCTVWFYTHINIMHRVFDVLCVASGFKEPRGCAPLFGSLTKAYSVQSFWGRVWHQFYRRPFASHGRFVAYNILHLTRKSRAAYLVQLFVAFAISGLIHVGGDYAVIGRPTFGALHFFLLQAIIIPIEDMVVKAAKTLRIPESWYWIGYFWVFAWATYSVPIWLDPLFRAGLAETSIKFSLLDILIDAVQRAQGTS